MTTPLRTSILALPLLLAPAAAAPAPPATPEVVIYGGTPAGLAAAVSAGQAGRNVLLVEPYSWVGGLTTNGLSHPDFRTFEGLTGFYLAFTKRVHAYYVDKYGADSPQARDSLHGTHGEPHVHRLVLERMLAELPTVEVRTRTRLKSVERSPDGARLLSAAFAAADGTEFTTPGSVWIDATYEGDLLAAAGVPYRVGREARDEYGESLAPEQADRQVQGYNFRLAMTSDPANRVTPSPPAGYRREDFLSILPLLEQGRIDSVFGYGGRHVYKDQIPHLPNDKRDINDVSRSPTRLSLPNLAASWPDGDQQERQRIHAAHVRHNVGLLHFLQTDPAVPAAHRDDARRWGWCRDEFTENAHLPEQLYVREARRMVGRHVFTQADTDRLPGDARTRPRPDAIAFGDYGLNCHGTSHDGPPFGGLHSGEFYKATPPYQIPYGVILPKDHRNLLVPVACSASHVGFCALRLEPIWASLGEAAGLAAALALENDAPVQDVDVPELQRRLHARGAATIYVSDVPRDSPDFIPVQWWAACGGLHGLADTPADGNLRGPKIVGQYHEAYPNHAADLDRPLDPALRTRWTALAATLDLPAEPLAAATTRRDFIRHAHDAALDTKPPAKPN